MAKHASRRQVLSGAVLLPAVALALTVAACEERELKVTCYDPEKQPDNAGLRQALHYVEVSSDTQRTCSGCAFFKTAEEACGRCQIFDGPANPRGHCDSWSARKSA